MRHGVSGRNMPGPFAHMVAAEQAQLRARHAGCELIAASTLRYPAWLQAGAIGPDYPYLTDYDSPASGDWANRLHREKTGDSLRHGIWWLYDRARRQDEADFQKAAAWLAGYLSHVVLDATVHPVVAATVGDGHDLLAHRRCEMVMDAHICRNRLGYELVFDEWAQHIRNTRYGDRESMDPIIKAIWSHMLRQTYGKDFRATPPRFDDWQRAYLRAIESVAGDIIFFRHAASGSPFVDIACDGISEADRRKFIEHCRPPAGNRFGKINMHFDEVFASGVDNILRYWSLMENAIQSRGDLALPELANWDLDLGITHSTGDGLAMLWG